MHQQISVDVFLESVSTSLCRLRLGTSVGKSKEWSIGVFAKFACAKRVFSHLVLARLDFLLLNWLGVGFAAFVPEGV